MFRRSYNRMVLHLRLRTETPLLIRAGDAGLDPTASDLVAVRSRHAAVDGPTVYIPGSSLRGVLRSSAEAQLRSVEKGGAVLACDPLSRDSACDRKSEMKGSPERGIDLAIQTARIFTAHCRCCRTFGSTALKGRVAIRDLFPFRPELAATTDRANLIQANRLEHRHSVALDRLTGAAGGGKLFDMEVVPPGVDFWGEIALENLQIWQLGLLAAALGQLNDGFAQLGSSKGRGFGQVSASVEHLVFEQVGRELRPSGVGLLASPQERAAYALQAGPAEQLPPSPSEVRGLSRRFEVGDPSPWLEAGHKALAEVLA